MGKWKMRKLGSLTQIQLGKTPARKTARFWDPHQTSNNVLLSIADLTHGQIAFDSKEYISNEGASLCKIVPQGTMMMSFKLSIGRVAFAGCDLYTNEAIASFVNLSSEINQRYLYYYLTFFDWEAATEGEEKVKGKTLNKAKLKELPVFFPPLPEQKRLVAKLDLAFGELARARGLLERGLVLAGELYTSSIENLLQRKQQWKYLPMKSICTLINGRAYKKKELLDDGKYMVLRVGNFFTNKHYYYSNLELNEDKYCDEGDLLYAWSASFGPRIWEGDKVIYHYHIWKVVPDYKVVTRDFLYLLLDWDKERIKTEHGAGTTMVHVSKRAMEARVLPIPSIEEQKRIVQAATQIRAQTQSLQTHYTHQLSLVEELRQSLLGRAFAGAL